MKVNDVARLRELAESGLMDSPSEECFDRFTRLACQILSVPVSLVSLVDEERQFFKSSCGLGEPWLSARETGHDHSFCKHVVGQDKPLVVQNAHENSLVHRNLAIKDLGVVAYAGYPLRTTSGQVLGSFCAIDSKVREWTDLELQALKALADSVATEISLRMEVASHRESLERLKIAKNAALHANETKSRFLTSVSHELRTPLNSIIGFTQMIHDSEEIRDFPKQLRHSANVLRSANHLLSLVDQILDLSQVEMGKLSLDLQRVELIGLVRRTLFEIQPQIRKKSLVFNSVFSGPEVYLRADPSRVRQILLNLLDNAMKFTDSGTITLQVECRLDKVTVLVKDTGRGLNKDDFEKVFEPFERLSSEAKGTGLGLSISRELAEAMGGSLNVESRGQNQGSTFSLELPTWRDSVDAR